MSNCHVRSRENCWCSAHIHDFKIVRQYIFKQTLTSCVVCATSNSDWKIPAITVSDFWRYHWTISIEVCWCCDNVLTTFLILEVNQKWYQVPKRTFWNIDISNVVSYKQHLRQVINTSGLNSCLAMIWSGLFN